MSGVVHASGTQAHMRPATVQRIWHQHHVASAVLTMRVIMCRRMTFADAVSTLCHAGESMYLRVNGVPLYVRGANVIPFDVLPTRASRANLTRLLTAAKRANMNMIRIWWVQLSARVWVDSQQGNRQRVTGRPSWLGCVCTCGAQPLAQARAALGCAAFRRPHVTTSLALILVPSSLFPSLVACVSKLPVPALPN